MIFDAYPGEHRDLQWVTVSLTVIATLLVTWRISNAVTTRGWLGLDDAFVVAANVSLIIFTALLYESTVHGFGKHVVDIEKSGGDVKKALKFFWITQTIYTLTNGLNKMAFLALYYRVFPMQGFRRACWVLGVISVGWTISYIFVTVFQCSPVPRMYDRTIPGTCTPQFWPRWTKAILNLLTDLAIFILPMPIIFRLNMTAGSRIGLAILFSLGFFICLTTALRMATLPLTLKGKEPTWESAPTNLWSFIESATGVICACLISLRKSIGALWPKRWRSRNGTWGAYRQYDDSGRSGRRNGTGGSHAMGDIKSGSRKPDMYGAEISLSESQERIMEERGKTVAHITTSHSRSGSRDGSEDLVLQGITVTTDVKVERDLRSAPESHFG